MPDQAVNVVRLRSVNWPTSRYPDEVCTRGRMYSPVAPAGTTNRLVSVRAVAVYAIGPLASGTGSSVSAHTMFDLVRFSGGTSWIAHSPSR